MIVVDEISTPGRSAVNEDRVGHAGAMSWVIDGATDLYGDSVFPYASDVQWLVSRVDHHLRCLGGDADSKLVTDGRPILHSVADSVAREQRDHDFPSCRVSPCCSVVVSVQVGESIQICRIGDASGFVGGAAARGLLTSYFDRQEEKAVREAHRESLEPDEIRRRMVARRVGYMAGSGAEGVLSGAPGRRLLIRSLTVPAAAGLPVLLCSDGFARAVVDYKLYATWQLLLAASMRLGLAAIERQIREFEVGNAGGGGRFKSSDDVSAIVTSVRAVPC